MDGLPINASNAMTGSVVRQFAPSRIERQLLAQVFELVCGQPSDGDASRLEGQMGGARTYARGNRGPVIEGQIAGRRVA
jgi:hypothetical protein